ncbi:Mycocerosic acid synthase-like polyketide synthase [Seminavis robusta]|uniref:Mycocerosic acid synthase-like polyketide synthase n=1 Tax=Seminavis robusta TaxID=568900 RepID=A0A9N8DDF0_9STRA|nr:Mycocerosic acid synthase-like polyketide synthase [Seminavis robusta]|eukprot:Sro23_g015730.1 Mycocerosic acid synthase-like polyketide synthase (347) ;mRNA; f:60687-61727
MTEAATTDTDTPTMKAAILHKNGDPLTEEVLSLDDVPIPEPKEGEFLVKIHAASINPVDWKLMNGDIPGYKSGPTGSDLAGTIEKIGPNTTTTDLKVGDAVYGDSIATKGSFGEYCIVPATVASKKPSNISFAEAASLPLAGLTALQGLQNHGNFEKGQKVLIYGGSGGVGSLAIQMAKALGASEVYSTGSNVELIKGLGADVVVNYKEESLMDALKGKDFDLVFDTIGGLEHWQIAQASLKKGGRFITVVGDGGSLVSLIAKATWRKMLGSVGLGIPYAFFLTDTTYDGLGKDMAQMTEMVEGGKVKALLDERRFELTQEGLQDFIKASMSHRAKGKLILQVQKE